MNFNMVSEKNSTDSRLNHFKTDCYIKKKRSLFAGTSLLDLQTLLIQLTTIFHAKRKKTTSVIGVKSIDWLKSYLYNRKQIVKCLK